MFGATPTAVHFWLLVNVLLQVCDGFLTYQGLQLGLQEGNPLVRASMASWGIGWALVGWKMGACLLLLLVYSLGTRLVVVAALAVTATSYVGLSFLPWIALLLSRLSSV